MRKIVRRKNIKRGCVPLCFEQKKRKKHEIDRVEFLQKFKMQ